MELIGTACFCSLCVAFTQDRFEKTSRAFQNKDVVGISLAFQNKDGNSLNSIV